VPASSADMDALHEALDGIEEAAQHGAAVSGRLLGFSRRDSHDAEVLDMAAVCASLSIMLRQLLPANVLLTVVPPIQPLFVRIDRNELDLALLDVASNARDAMPEGGRFTVSVHGGAAVSIQCVDTGAGIDPALIERVSEPFFTTKPRGHGTGLGLATVYGTMRRAGGDLSISSAVGRGATVTLSLPHAVEVDA
jgi:signal transduction histidine kinase